MYCNSFIILSTQIICKQQAKTFLILQYSTLKSTVYSKTADTQVLAWSEQARRVTYGGGRGGGRWESSGLSATGNGGRAAVHAHLTFTAQVLIPCWIQFYLPSSKINQ